MDEREFFDERSDKKPANLSCPHCQQSAEYEIQWLVRMKKKNLPLAFSPMVLQFLASR